MRSGSSFLRGWALVPAIVLGGTLAAGTQTPAPAAGNDSRATARAHLELQGVGSQGTGSQGTGSQATGSQAAGSRRTRKAPPAVLWLQPLSGKPAFWPADAGRSYQLVQKDRSFRPHLLVIPAGSLVSFPNQDPFFHNVFSLFEGKRFDLGLYQAGSTREVRFSNPGISYIFCNIHPSMSAVIIALTTPWFAVGDTAGTFTLQVPEGNYTMHVWVEGAPQGDLDRLTRVVHIDSAQTDLGGIAVPTGPGVGHTNKFGGTYTDPAVAY